MNQDERLNDFEEALRSALDGRQAEIWTALPGIITSCDGFTAEVQPAQKLLILQRDGSTKWVAMPPIVDAPVIFPSGGGFTLTFPIKPGDECLLIIASRCIDTWWQLGGVQVQAELRMHSLSDGFVLVGPRSKPRQLSGISTTSTQLRSDDGETFVEVAADQIVNVIAPGGINLTTQGKITMLADQGIDATTAEGMMNFNAPTQEINLNTPVTNVDGALAQGIGTGGGDAHLAGNAQIDGATTGAGEGTFRGIDVSVHTHLYHPGGGGATPTDPPAG